jgi:hypothetical protein
MVETEVIPALSLVDGGFPADSPTFKSSMLEEEKQCILHSPNQMHPLDNYRLLGNWTKYYNHTHQKNQRYSADHRVQFGFFLSTGRRNSPPSHVQLQVD